MNFRTRVPVTEGISKIEHGSGIFLIGSCFVENIGSKLDRFKFKNLQNPTGIIFHPSPIRKFFQRLSNKEAFQEKDLIEFNGGWQSFEAHSDMRRPTKADCLKDLNLAIEGSRDFIENASHIVISLGTAWGYVYEGKATIAANCHKIPQSKFIKELSSVNEIINDLEVIDHAVSQINKEAKIIFTISPVRHLKDGFIENQHSKANLISALHQFIDTSNSSFYFPSYEIMMDELRDYRFYKEDMLHPSKVAVDYIWNLFSVSWLSDNSLRLNSEIDKIQKALAHTPREENSSDHKKFLTKIKSKIEEIQKKHPEITFS
ncbi:GSCFA domain-containing protein [Christiangramia sabulilitoris]|uniref:GSCFA domain-containing protein n=1 Tax=Christiangramia sabulilitoris TaxID=2583991 RepID=A0A550HZL8_9FLAO|nr:GSCFA domain-containing protein [Christiangramia sabulilitoris]TRO64187.1 GSCFA domain-containing protein [Christiangramia sabulilitoris]